MTFERVRFLARRHFFLGASAFTLIVLGTLAGAAVGKPDVQVSQKGREFQPNEVSLKRGDTLRIVNDDGDLLHHAYIDSDSFSFDSGDQEPGSRADIVFSVVGDFKVLCGIHPRMKLVVHVQ